MTQSFKKSASHGESYHRESSLPHGLFITFEGIEGSGKTTQIQMLEEVLKKKSIPYITTREPGGTKIAEAIRHILLNPDLKEMRPETELLLYCASRAQHTAELILPALAEGKIVLCDRYFDSTYAYQGVHEKAILLIHQMQTTLFQNLIPSITFLLDIDPEISLQRIQRKKDQFEALLFLTEVRKRYQKIAKENPERVIILDSNLSPLELEKKVLFYLKERGLFSI